MEKDEQIFIKLESDQEPVEFLLTKQPLNMIRGGFVTKNDIRNTIEMGSSYVENEYIYGFELSELALFVTVTVRIDNFLRIIDNVEKHIL